MQLKEHLIYGGAASLVLSPVFGIKSLFFFLGSVFIDLDHYIDFLYFGRFKDWKIKSMFSFHKKGAEWVLRENLCALEAFHTAEFLIALLALAAYFHSPELFLLFSGMIFHLMLDLIRLKQWGAIQARALSFLEYWFRSRKMRSLGIDPEKIYFEVYAASKAKSASLQK